MCRALGILSILVFLITLRASNAEGRPKDDGVTRFAVVDMRSFTREDAPSLMKFAVENRVDVLAILYYSSGDAKVASRIGFDLQHHKYHASVNQEHDILLASPSRSIKLQGWFSIFQTESGRHVLIGGHATPSDTHMVRAALAVKAHLYRLKERRAVGPDYIYFWMSETQKPQIFYPSHLRSALKDQGALDDGRFVFTDLNFPPVKEASIRHSLREAVLKHFWWILALTILFFGLLILIIVLTQRKA